MLILSRRQGESIIISDSIEISITEVKRDQVRLGIKAPSNVKVLRKEIYKQIEEFMLGAVQDRVDEPKLAELQKILQQRDTEIS